MPKLVKVLFVLFVEDQNKLIAARSFNKAKRKQISLTIEKNNQATGKKKSYMFTCKFLSKQLGSNVLNICRSYYLLVVSYMYKPHKDVTVKQIQRKNPENYGEKCAIQCLEKIITLKVFFLINDR